MKLIIDIPDQEYEDIQAYNINMDGIDVVCESILHGTPISDNATNGDVIKVMFGDDKVSEFMSYARIMARVGNWFNEGVVAEFDKDWWNAPYKAEGSENEK